MELAFTVVALSVLGAAGCSDTRGVDRDAPSVGRPFIVASDVRHDTSAPLRELTPSKPTSVPSPPQNEFKAPAPNDLLPPSPLDIPQEQTPQSDVGALAAPPIGVNFEGLGAGIPGGSYNVVPDTNAAVGATQIVEIVNHSIGIFNKSGTLLSGPLALNSVFQGLGGRCEADIGGDPVVRYDNVAGRWIIAYMAYSAPYAMCYAISATSDATGSWHRYEFSWDMLPDYPKLGVWRDGYYVAFNASPSICVLDRTRMLSGLSATQQCFGYGTPNIPADLDGTVMPPAGTPGFAVGFAGSNMIRIFKVTIDWTTPANSSITHSDITASETVPLCGGGGQGECVPQPGTTQKLSPLSSMAMYRLAYRNFGTHQSMVFARNVESGAAKGLRWYELRIAGSNVSLHQEGTFAPDDGVYRWMGSAAMDKRGNIAIGYTVSNATNVYPGIRYTGRLVSDPLGQMPQGEGTIVTGTGSLTATHRWGDYSSTAVDPVDDCTFWHANEYVQDTSPSAWRSRIASFKFADCTSSPPVFTDTFETNLGWTVNAGGTDTATSGRWERGDPAATSSGGAMQLGTTPSGTNCLVTGRLAGASASANDLDGGVSSIRSPQIVLPAAANLTLSFKWYLAHLNTATNADYFRIKVITTSATTQIFERRGAASRVNAAWVTSTVDLSSYAGQTIRLEIEAADASPDSLIEAAVDDVIITQ